MLQSCLRERKYIFMKAGSRMHFLNIFFKVQISEACNEQAVWLHRTALVIPSKTEVSLYRACHAVHLRTK